jgi:hypothetical protein
MLRWEFEKGEWLGFDDAFLYRVAQDGNGWYYEAINTQDGMDGYATAEEAKEAAEADYQFWQNFDNMELELDPEILEEIAEAEAELEGEGLEHWMNSNIFATYRSDWD